MDLGEPIDLEEGEPEVLIPPAVPNHMDISLIQDEDLVEVENEGETLLLYCLSLLLCTPLQITVSLMLACPAYRGKVTF